MIAVEIVSLYPPGPAGESDRARWTMHTEPGAATQPRHVEIGCPGCARPMRLDGYKIEPGGVVTPTSSLVTGYDFLEDVAREVQFELEQGTGQIASTLILTRDVSPADPRAWSADDLRGQLLGSPHDIMFLAGHFSANSALAADYTTRLFASEVAASPLDLTNAIVFSPGCHAGYNIVDAHGVPLVTREPDWARPRRQRVWPRPAPVRPLGAPAPTVGWTRG